MYPDDRLLELVPGDAHVVMSEPLGSLPGAWSEVEPSTAVHLRRGHIEVRPFTPRALS